MRLSAVDPHAGQASPSDSMPCVIDWLGALHGIMMRAAHESLTLGLFLIDSVVLKLLNSLMTDITDWQMINKCER